VGGGQAFSDMGEGKDSCTGEGGCGTITGRKGRNKPESINANKKKENPPFLLQLMERG